MLGCFILRVSLIFYFFSYLVRIGVVFGWCIWICHVWESLSYRRWKRWKVV